jgi:hypothetical protein
MGVNVKTSEREFAMLKRAKLLCVLYTVERAMPKKSWKFSTVRWVALASSAFLSREEGRWCDEGVARI